LLLGIGSGYTTSPLLLTAMKDVGGGDSGLASGICEHTALLLGGALGARTWQQSTADIESHSWGQPC